MGRIKNRYKVAKHFELEIEDGRFKYARRTEAITREAQLDGFHILRTSEPDDRLPTAEVVRSYKNLTNVERAFRSLKTVELQIRPIRHRTETRVRSHLFLCLLSYYVEWHLRRALAPLLFDDEDLEAHRARRDPVFPIPLHASGGDGPHTLVQVDLRPDRPPDLAGAGIPITSALVTCPIGIFPI